MSRDPNPPNRPSVTEVWAQSRSSLFRKPRGSSSPSRQPERQGYPRPNRRAIRRASFVQTPGPSRDVWSRSGRSDRAIPTPPAGRAAGPRENARALQAGYRRGARPANPGSAWSASPLLRPTVNRALQTCPACPGNRNPSGCGRESAKAASFRCAPRAEPGRSPLRRYRPPPIACASHTPRSASRGPRYRKCSYRRRASHGCCRKDRSACRVPIARRVTLLRRRRPPSGRRR